MVVSCQKCRTRFQLDEARIPAKGVRVRCSKCKHAFFVAPPVSDDQTMHRLAEQAAASGGPEKPDATVDLSDPELTKAPSSPGRSGGSAAHDPEDDWQFNVDPPGGAAAREATPPPPAEFTDSEPSASEAERFFELDGLPDPTVENDPREEKPARGKTAKGKDKAKEAPRAPSPIAPEQEVSFQDLGSPEGWDLGAPEKKKSAEPAKPARPARPKPGRTAAAAAPSAPAARSEPEPARAARRVERGQPAPLSARAVGSAGWLGVAVLFALGLYGPLSARHVARELTPSAVGPLELDALHVRHLENLWVGPLVVVSAELRNPGKGPARAGVVPLVRVIDSRGEALPLAPAWVGEELPEASLRGSDPKQLAELLSRSAQALGERSLAPNEKVAVQAVLAELPAEATDLRVETQALAAAPDPARERADATPPPASPQSQPDPAAGAAPAAAPAVDPAAEPNAAPSAAQTSAAPEGEANPGGAAPPAPPN